MKTTKKLLAFFMAAMMLFTVLPVMNASAKTVAGGICGKNVTWTLDDKGTLTISGKGEMYDYPAIAISNECSPFKFLKGIKKIKITDGVTSIGSSAFRECNSSITSVSIPDSVTSIGHDAFFCTGLKNITIPNSVKSIGDSAFCFCSGLANITMSDNITNLGANAFYYTAYYNNSSNWKDDALYIGKCLVAVKESVGGAYKVKAGTKCIAGGVRSNFTSVTIPKSVKGISEGAFAYSSKLKSIKVDSENKYYSSENGILFNKNKTKLIKYPPMKTATSYTVPDSVKNIENYAFSYCNNLTSITISDKVTSLGEYTFSNCEKLESLKIGKSLKSIDENVFSWRGAPNLKSISVDPDNKFFSSKNGVLFNKNKTEIVIYPENKDATSYTVPDSVKSIADDTFRSGNLKSIKIGKGVESINESGLGSTIKSISVDPDNKVYSSKDGVLFNKNKTEIIIYPSEKTSTSYTIPDSVKNIAEYTFEYCTNLKSIIIGKGVENIEYYAFRGCDNLNSITIPDSVKSISRSAFYDTAYYNNSSNWKNGTLYIGKHLIDIKSDEISEAFSIKSGTRTVGNFSFGKEVTSITVPKSVRNLACSFPYYGSLKSINVDSENKYYSSKNGVLFNKNKTELIKYPNRKTATSYTIPSSVKDIADGAFSDCDNLESVTIPDGVNSIPRNAFDSCDKLKSITIPDSVTNIGDRAFLYCRNLKSVKIGSGVKTIDYDAFIGCSSLTSIKIGNNVESIDSSAFLGTAYYDDSSNWKDGVLYIGKYLISADSDKISGTYTVKTGTRLISDYAFRLCENLTGINLPDSLKIIGKYAFDECGKLKSVTIPKNLKSIGESAFSDCIKLQSITIPESVTSIGASAFYDCNKLATIKLSDKLTSIGLAAFSGTAYYNNPSNWKNEMLYIGKYLIKAAPKISGSYKIKSTTLGIADYAFDCCRDLTNITIPSGVKFIGNNAFENCGLKSVEIPKSVKIIGERALGINDPYSEFGGIYKVDNFKIIGFKGSAAETYAKDNGFKFVTHKHSYTSKVTTKATTSKSGKITYTCTCGYSYSKTISKIKSVTLSKTSYTYDGNTKKPTVTVKDSNGNKLKSGTDYTVKYSSGRKNVGKYTVTVTFKGKYSGTKKLTFKIVPKGTSVSKLTAGKKQFKATWKKQSTQTTGYQLQYSTSSKMTNATTKTYADTGKTSLTVKNLKSAKTYFVRIRTYKNVKIDGKTTKLYSSWSKVKSVKTK